MAPDRVGTAYAAPNPTNPTIFPNYCSPILRNNDGHFYVEDKEWFGTFMLPENAKDSDVLQVAANRWARISFT
jgi:hypothetical protein